MKINLSEKRRKLIQIVSAVLYNTNLKGLQELKIYQGDMKNFCVPGLNCYSCPLTTYSCPLGSFQTALANMKYKNIPYYIIGLLMLFGIVLGRIICGFLCPFGLFEEILYKIKTKKINKNKITKKLSLLKYFILIIFVIIIPIFFFYPAFCKYICPQGILEAGLILTSGIKELKLLRGVLFFTKFIILVVVVILSIFIYRVFCRFICPLGAIYSLFNKHSMFNIILDENKCINCNKCIEKCKMDITVVGDRECISCLDCINICPANAIKFGYRYKK